MLVVLGILSIFQLVFLPGLVVTRFLKLQGIGRIIFVSLALSPVINFLFVFFLTTLGIYNQPVTLVLFGIEFALLIYLDYPSLNKPVGEVVNFQGLLSFSKEYLNPNERAGWLGVFIKTILILVFSFSVYSILNYIFIYALQKTEVFTTWDAVVSWDRWATDWFHNRLPNMTWHYPQLIPANWSLTYQFLGDARIKFFAKSFMGLIEVNILLVIFILGIIKRQVGYFLGVISTAWLQLAFGSQANGYVDSAVAFFALSSVTCLLVAIDENNQVQPIYIYLGAFLAAGSALTKQAGLWMLIAYPILFLFTIGKKEERSSTYRYLLGIFTIYALAVLPWYGYKEYQMWVGKESTEVAGITSQAIQHRNGVEQFTHALGLLQEKMIYQTISGSIMMVLLVLLIFFSFQDGLYLSLFGIVIAPFFFIWTFFFSYDTRNLNLIVPMLGLTTGIGAQQFIEWLSGLRYFLPTCQLPNHSSGFRPFQIFIRFIKSIKTIVFVLPVLLVFLLPLKYTDSYLLKKSIAKQKEIGYLSVNQKIYAYQAEFGLTGRILTDYQYLWFLPGLESYYAWADQGANLIRQLNEPEVGYALLNNDLISPEVAAYLKEQVAQGKMKTIFIDGSYSFTATCHGLCDK